VYADNAHNARAEYLTTTEVAQALRVAPQTVRRLVATGEIAAVRIGRQWRISPDDLARFLVPSGGPKEAA
jgi:excisionase family DNA binding protein